MDINKSNVFIIASVPRRPFVCIGMALVYFLVNKMFKAAEIRKAAIIEPEITSDAKRNLLLKKNCVN